MQIIKKSARNLTERFIGSSFAQKSVMAAIALIISTSNVIAGSKGAAGFTKATQEVSSYQTPVSNLMKAIAAVIVLVGALFGLVAVKPAFVSKIPIIPDLNLTIQSG